MPKITKKKVVKRKPKKYAWLKKFTKNHIYITVAAVIIIWIAPILIVEPEIAVTGIAVSKSVVMTIWGWLIANWKIWLTALIMLPTAILKWKEVFKKN